MNRVVLYMVIMITAASGIVTAQAQDIETFVRAQLERYPQSRLLDIYKSCFQDYMGPEHLVSDTASVRAYLEQELANTDVEELMPWYYEPCGVDGNHVRVSLRAVKEGCITAEALIDAFIASANGGKRPSVEQWAAIWREMVTVIDGMEFSSSPFYGQDRQFIEDVLDQGYYAISHSPDYRDAYAPHYRIVSRDIFERDLLPLLPCTCCQHPCKRL